MPGGAEGRAQAPADPPARYFVESSGATFLGVSLLVDQLDPAVRSGLGRVTALASADDLGDPCR